jgi:hypothetical protein
MRLYNGEQADIIVALTSEGAPATGLTVSIGIVKASDGSDVTPTPATLTSIGLGLYKLPANKMPDTTDDTLAWRIDGSDTLADADRYKFGAVLFGGEAEDRIDAIDASLASIATDTNYTRNNLATGIGTYEYIDHDSGGTDNLRFTDDGGLPISGAQIGIWLKTDWDSNVRTESARKGWAQTLSDGRWDRQCGMENAATYVIMAQVSGATQQTTKEYTVA